jgi:hypothetical protein
VLRSSRFHCVQPPVGFYTCVFCSKYNVHHNGLSGAKGDVRNAYKILVGKPEGNRRLETCVDRSVILR